jgi:hypothetical protein
VESRIREALGSDEVNTLVLRCPATSPDEHAASYAAGAHPLLDGAFERDALLRREHLDLLGINGLALAFTIVERAARSPGFTHAVAIAPATKIDLTRARIDKLLAGRALAGDPDRLLSATLRVPEGTIFAEEQEGPGADKPSTVTARYAEAALIEPVGLTLHLLFLMTFLHEAPDVRAGIARFTEELGLNAEDAMKQALPGIEQALLAGLLEVA